MEISTQTAVDEGFFSREIYQLHPWFRAMCVYLFLWLLWAEGQQEQGREDGVGVLASHIPTAVGSARVSQSPGVDGDK